MWKYLLPLLLCVVPLAAEYQVAVVTDNFVIHTADGSFPGQDKFAASLNEQIDRLQMSTGVYLDGKADIYIVPTRAAYQEIARGKSSIVEFSEAFYTSEEQRIYVRSADQIWENYGGIIVHEYTHWFLDQVFMNAPLWFHEGMATLEGNQLGLERYYYFIRERFWGNKLDLVALAYDYPKDRGEWEMYYLTSYFAVRYMKDKDTSSWKNFWYIAAQNHDRGAVTRFNSALMQAYNMSLSDFNLDFAKASKRQAYVYLAVGINSLVFSLMPVLVVIAMIKYRRRMNAMPEIDAGGDDGGDSSDEGIEEEPECQEMDEGDKNV
jgi:hypothetical protein